jgi:hypothetical protein
VKSIELLWRGSRDGFTAKAFHSRSDGHSNTLTIIADTGGNIFGGFTPLPWESIVWNEQQGLKSNTLRGDGSLRTFLFTLKNPLNSPAMKFPLKPDRQQYAIVSCIDDGPTFGYGLPDLWVDDRCDESSRNQTIGFGWNFDCSAASMAGINPTAFLTGGELFTVREIEVFAISQ